MIYSFHYNYLLIISIIKKLKKINHSICSFNILILTIFNETFANYYIDQLSSTIKYNN
jgi:hypothetical protein